MSAVDMPAGAALAGDARGHGEGGPASTFVIVSFGFWVFLLSDIVMFSALFAAHAVLQGHTAGGPTGRELFSLPRVAIETGCLLLSSFTCGLMTIAVRGRHTLATYGFAAVTVVLGAIFLSLELSEFAGMIAHGAGPSRSAFLSSFFAVVGTHGLHVTVGLIWLMIMMAQIATRGYRPTTIRRLYCFSLFWHALDIVWVAVFTVVYLMGAA
jgi:cytochrome o ubiquinol oxidase subunit III